MTKTIATIQCRMTSTRLPGKILLPACGKPLLAHMIERLNRVPGIDQIVIATTTNAQDDCLEEFAHKNGLGCHRGSEQDVLKRIVEAAQKYQGDTLVHLTSDCPLIDPIAVQQVIDKYQEGKWDFVSNCLERTYPRGMDTQVFSRKILEKVDAIATEAAHREHVTLYIVEKPHEFACANISAPREYRAPEIRMTLDYPEDYALIHAVFEALYPHKPDFLLYDILNYLKAHPEVAALTAGIEQKDVRAPAKPSTRQPEAPWR
jgi:spore coat polysaccharide biosynthesis protein SpsF